MRNIEALQKKKKKNTIFHSLHSFPRYFDEYITNVQSSVWSPCKSSQKKKKKGKKERKISNIALHRK